MLPNPKDSPPPQGQQLVIGEVTLNITSELPRPISGVCPRRTAVLWTPMPIATVHEHGDTRSSKDDVDSASDAWFRPGVLEKPKSPRM